MPNASPFERLSSRASERVTVFIEEMPVEVSPRDTAATAVMLAGMLPSRTTPASGSPRAPYCLMGVCFECLLEIDGVANQQGCMIRVQDGMRIRRQLGARRITEISGRNSHEP